MKYSALKIIELVFVNLITTTRLLGAFALPFIYVLIKIVRKHKMWNKIIKNSKNVSHFTFLIRQTNIVNLTFH